MTGTGDDPKDGRADDVYKRLNAFCPGRPDGREKKHPCPDCHFCQFCSDARCEQCLVDQKRRAQAASCSRPGCPALVPAGAAAEPAPPADPDGKPASLPVVGPTGPDRQAPRLPDGAAGGRPGKTPDQGPGGRPGPSRRK
ncbi:MAG: hypothetical protein GX442_13950 [Candidatus Riflebacteria bacterium]|nr:hypothetical protein [Candidatus Riflebacteria bacterium]